MKGLKGKEENGVFVQVAYERTGQNEIVISNMIQTPFTPANYN